MLLGKRVTSPEIMDDFSINDNRINQAIDELKIINKLLGGKAATKNGIKEFSKLKNKKYLKVLDIGSGGADVFDFFLEGISIKVSAIDKNIQAARYLKYNNPEMDIICADAKALPFKNLSFDIIHFSLILHHFTDSEISNLMNGYRAVTNGAILINDLRRNIIAYWGIKVLTYLFSRSDMVKNDGPLSVRKGFTKKELVTYFKSSYSLYMIKRKWAFRWLVLIITGEKYAANRL